MARRLPQPRRPRTPLEQLHAKAKRNKWGNVPTVVDGIRFHSAAEARRWSELRLMEKAGAIRGLRRQPWYLLMAPFMGPKAIFDINDWQKTYRREIVGKYVADFSYYDSNSELVIEDVKGKTTPMFDWKRRHFEAQYATPIRIVTMPRVRRRSSVR